MRTTSTILLRHRPDVNPLLPTCRVCHARLPFTHYNAAGLLPCPQCGRPIRVAVFPSLVRRSVVGGERARIMGGEASCFYHATNPAVRVCDGCGRFLCELCDVELSGHHLCPPCLEAGRRKRTLTRLESRRVLYDNVALLLALLPLLSCFFFPVTSPMAIAVAIWGWRKPSSLLPRTKIRFVLAILIGFLGMGLGIAFWIAIFTS